AQPFSRTPSLSGQYVYLPTPAGVFRVTGWPIPLRSLPHALDDEGACGRVVEPARQDLLVFGRIVPALECGTVGEFQDNDAFGLWPAFDKFGGAGPGEEAAAILLDRGADRCPVGFHRGLVGDLEFDDEIGGHVGLPWLTFSRFGDYGHQAGDPSRSDRLGH